MLQWKSRDFGMMCALRGWPEGRGRGGVLIGREDMPMTVVPDLRQGCYGFPN